MKIDKQEGKKYLLLLIFLIGMIFYFLHYQQKLSSLYKEQGARFSIGKITFDDTRSSAHGVLFKYNGKNIEVRTSPIGDWPNSWREIGIEGRRIYVVFPSKSPEDANFIASFKVPDNLPAPPYRGWTLEELQKLDPDFKPEGLSDWW